MKVLLVVSIVIGVAVGSSCTADKDKACAHWIKNGYPCSESWSIFNCATTCCTQETPAPKRVIKVAVVGAGVSGLTTARTLLDNWNETGTSLYVDVFEAQNRIGGRTWTLTNQEAPQNWIAKAAIVGGEADMGASWIHGDSRDHPISKIKTALSLSDKVDMKRTQNSLLNNYLPDQPDVLEDDKFNSWQALHTCAKKKAKEWKRGTPDTPLFSTLQDCQTDTNKLTDPLNQMYIASGPEFNTGGSILKMATSSLFLNGDEQYKGTELIWVKGYRQVVDALKSGTITFGVGKPPRRTEEGFAAVGPNITYVNPAQAKGIDVQLDSPLTAVDYTGKKVKLTVGGNQKEYDYAAITVPLGALKGNPDRAPLVFSPQLPERIQASIDKLGFGNVHKLCMLFDEVWWPSKETHYFSLAQSGENRRGLFSYFLNLFPLTGRPLIMTFGLGNSSYAADRLSDAEAWKEIASNFQQMWGKQENPPIIPQQPPMIRSNWSGNAYFGGAYTFIETGSTNKDIEDLSSLALKDADENPRVVFAGEHTSSIFRGTVHGAFFEGQKAANKIMKYVKSCRKKRC